MIRSFLFSIFILLGVIACASAPKKNNSHAKRSISSEKKIAKKADQKRLNNRQNLMGVKTQLPAKKKYSRAEKLQQIDKAFAGDEKIYKKFIASFHKGQTQESLIALRTLKKKNPNSPYIPEAYYVTSQSALAKKNYKTALKGFDLILKKYPKSEKSRAALLAKGLTYKEMNLKPQAKTVLQEVQQLYPQSPEAFRAGLQLRMIK